MQDHLPPAMAQLASAPAAPRPRPLPVGPPRHAFSPARFAPLFREGEIRSLVEVEPDGMVDVAVQQLGARLVAVGVVIPPRN